MHQDAQALNELRKHFPDSQESVVFEYKCSCNDRTSRGSLFVTPFGLYFNSQMLGNTKRVTSFESIRDVKKDGSGLSASIIISSTSGIEKYCGFAGKHLDEAFRKIEEFYHKQDDTIQPEQPTNQPLEGTNKEETQSEQQNISKEPKSPEVSKASNSSQQSSQDLKAILRQRQIDADQARKTSELKTKEKAKELAQLNAPPSTVRRPSTPQKTTTTSNNILDVNSQQTIENLLRLAKKILVVFFSLLIGSFVLSSIIIESWSLLLIISVLLASVDVALDSKNLSKLLATKVLPFITSKNPLVPQATAIGFLLLIHLLNVLITAFLLEDFSIGIITGSVCVIFVNLPDIIRVFL